MPTSAHAARTDFTKIPGEFAAAAWADVGIGPYMLLRPLDKSGASAIIKITQGPFRKNGLASD